MKYCLNSRQHKLYLAKADEIMVKAIDYQQRPALFIDYPNVTIILEVNNEQMQDEKTKEIIKQYAQDNPENFCCCIYDLQYAKWFKNKGQLEEREETQ